MMVNKEYCLSSFLLYRRVVDPELSFAEDRVPKTIPLVWEKTDIHNSIELEGYLKKSIEKACEKGKVALALSGGIDSAILAKMMPKGSTAYTFKCIVDGKDTVDETIMAAKYAKECGLEHKIVEIHWDDMVKYAPKLMDEKNAPIHSIEVQIYLGAMKAKEDGFDTLVFGESADVNYGGLSNVLSREWHVGEFIERYAYVKPWMVLKNPKVDFSCVSKYTTNGMVEVHDYLANFDIIESINSYVNACEAAGVHLVAPFAETKLAVPLDYNRVRSGENKYLIREIFSRLYLNWEIPVKIPMPRPMDEWMKSWQGPTREEFLPRCVEVLNGDQKWLVWCLEKFLNMLEKDDKYV